MTTPRIDLIGQNGGDGAHYKYEEIANKLYDEFDLYIDYVSFKQKNIILEQLTKILVENFPDA